MKFNIFEFEVHSIVDVITNSSTTIYTYQDGCEAPVRELINEMLKLSGISDVKSEDVFYMGTFCDDDRYFEQLEGSDADYDENVPQVIGEWGSEEYKDSITARTEWMKRIKLAIVMGEIKKPGWMKDVESGGDDSEYRPDNRLMLVPKNEKYTELGRAIEKVLKSVEADGGYDG